MVYALALCTASECRTKSGHDGGTPVLGTPEVLTTACGWSRVSIVNGRSYCTSSSSPVDTDVSTKASSLSESINGIARYSP